MDKVISQLEQAVKSANVIILRGMRPELGSDRCTRFWKILQTAGFEQESCVPEGIAFKETWVRVQKDV